MRTVRAPLACVPCVLLLFAGHELVAQVPAFEGKPIRTIRFNPTQQPLDASELHDILPLQMNRALQPSDVRASIERLFATGRYEDIQVDAQPYQDGVAITFITRNSWFIGAVTASGNISSPPNRGQIENAADLDLGQAFNPGRLQESVAGQKRLLESNGLYRSQIQPEMDWETTREYQQVNVRFLVDSGPRAHFTTPVLTGDLKIDPQRIFAATKFRRWLIHTWKPVTQTRIRQGLDGVRSLYQKENRLEAKVTLESLHYDPATNAAVPSLHIEAGPRIEVHPFGPKLSDKKLRRYVPIFEEHAVDHDLLVEGARNLQDYYQSQGYFEAEVQFKEQRVTNDKASIDFLINTGKRHKLVDIQIDGNRYFTGEALRERMYLRRASFLQFPHGRYSGSLLRRDRESIVNLYRSNGFRDAQVTTESKDDYRGKAGDIAVFIHVQEGPQYIIDRLDLEGIEGLNKESTLERLSSVAGQPFSEFNVAVDRDTILAQYFENGFPQATFEWAWTAAADPHRVNLKFTVREGSQQFVRQVVASGYTVTQPRLVDRALTLNPGDPLSPTRITETQRRLYDLGVFSKVDAAIQDPDGETAAKYVVYNLEEARRYSAAVGFGAELGRIGGCSNCLDAPAGATGFAPRVSLDVTRNNLWGLTHSISLRTRASTLDQRALLNYSWPRFGNSDNLNVSFTGLFEDSKDVRTFNFRRLEGSAQLSQKLDKATTLFYRLTYRRVGVSDLKINPFIVPQLSQPVRVGIASINLVQDRRDDPLDPHKGIYNTVDLGLAEHFLGSQRNFLRFLARTASYHPLGKRLVLARNTQIGDIYSFHFPGDPLDAIPLPERFFGGGGTSHRGFAENQGGPRDPTTGFPLGGTALLFNQTELRFPLIGENIGGVLYHDMGNVYSSLSNLSFRVRQHDNQDFNYMVHAVGFGLRYKLPIGPVRVDLGYSINSPSFIGFTGTQQDLLNAGVNPCATFPDKCSLRNSGHFQYFFSIGQTF